MEASPIARRSSSTSSGRQTSSGSLPTCSRDSARLPAKSELENPTGRKAESRPRQVDGENASRGAADRRASDGRARRSRSAASTFPIPLDGARLGCPGMRIGELERLTWRDIDEPRIRWRIATTKTGRPRWVTPPTMLFRRCSSSFLARTGTVTAECSITRQPNRLRTAMARRAPQPGCPRSRRTTSATVPSRSYIWAACHGRGSANSSATTP